MASRIKEISVAIDGSATLPPRYQTQAKGYSSIAHSSQFISVYFVLKKQLKPHSSSLTQNTAKSDIWWLQHAIRIQKSAFITDFNYKELNFRVMYALVFTWTIGCLGNK